MRIMKDLEEQYTMVQDDFQHQVENKIKKHKNAQGFPVLPPTVDEVMLSDYLFDYQAALDSEGTERTRYTIAGVLLILPILILSAFPEESLPFKGFLNVLCAIGLGFVLFLLYRIIMKVVVRQRLNSVNASYPDVKEYVDKILAFK